MNKIKIEINNILTFGTVSGYASQILKLSNIFFGCKIFILILGTPTCIFQEKEKEINTLLLPNTSVLHSLLVFFCLFKEELHENDSK